MSASGQIWAQIKPELKLSHYLANSKTYLQLSRLIVTTKANHIAKYESSLWKKPTIKSKTRSRAHWLLVWKRSKTFFFVVSSPFQLKKLLLLSLIMAEQTADGSAGWWMGARICIAGRGKNQLEWANLFIVKLSAPPSVLALLRAKAQPRPPKQMGCWEPQPVVIEQSAAKQKKQSGKSSLSLFLSLSSRTLTFGASKAES